jgi:hypothetical protein
LRSNASTQLNAMKFVPSGRTSKNFPQERIA